MRASLGGRSRRVHRSDVAAAPRPHASSMAPAAPIGPEPCSVAGGSDETRRRGYPSTRIASGGPLVASLHRHEWPSPASLRRRGSLPGMAAVAGHVPSASGTLAFACRFIAPARSPSLPSQPFPQHVGSTAQWVTARRSSPAARWLACGPWIGQACVMPKRPEKLPVGRVAAPRLRLRPKRMSALSGEAGAGRRVDFRGWKRKRRHRRWRLSVPGPHAVRYAAWLAGCCGSPYFSSIAPFMSDAWPGQVQKKA